MDAMNTYEIIDYLRGNNNVVSPANLQSAASDFASERKWQLSNAFVEMKQTLEAVLAGEMPRAESLPSDLTIGQIIAQHVDFTDGKLVRQYLGAVAALTYSEKVYRDRDGISLKPL